MIINDEDHFSVTIIDRQVQRLKFIWNVMSFPLCNEVTSHSYTPWSLLHNVIINWRMIGYMCVCVCAWLNVGTFTFWWIFVNLLESSLISACYVTFVFLRMRQRMCLWFIPSTTYKTNNVTKLHYKRNDEMDLHCNRSELRTNKIIFRRQIANRFSYCSSVSWPFDITHIQSVHSVCTLTTNPPDFTIMWQSVCVDWTKCGQKGTKTAPTNRMRIENWKWIVLTHSGICTRDYSQKS